MKRFLTALLVLISFPLVSHACDPITSAALLALSRYAAQSQTVTTTTYSQTSINPQVVAALLAILSQQQQTTTQSYYSGSGGSGYYPPTPTPYAADSGYSGYDTSSYSYAPSYSFPPPRVRLIFFNSSGYNSDFWSRYPTTYFPFRTQANFFESQRFRGSFQFQERVSFREGFRGGFGGGFRGGFRGGFGGGFGGGFRGGFREGFGGGSRVSFSERVNFSIR